MAAATKRPERSRCTSSTTRTALGRHSANVGALYYERGAGALPMHEAICRLVAQTSGATASTSALVRHGSPRRGHARSPAAQNVV